MLETTSSVRAIDVLRVDKYRHKRSTTMPEVIKKIGICLLAVILAVALAIPTVALAGLGSM